jgi:hypothetical protein
VSRKHLHLVLALILIGCCVCPFVEIAIGWNDTLFSTGYDTESMVAVIMLLVELVLALGSAVAFVLCEARVTEPLVTTVRLFLFEFDFGIPFHSFSSPTPLRI